MEENEKPFPCKVDGCCQSFSTEDHLNVHTKKHLLNLEISGKNAHFIDQTPTPTRFIRNCEEVGLFEELKNVNPFEETFRRAVEENSIHSVSDTDEMPNRYIDSRVTLSLVSRSLMKNFDFRFSATLQETSPALNEDIINPDDTLHTPQIFPHYLTLKHSSSQEPSHKRHKLAKLSITTPSIPKDVREKTIEGPPPTVIVANPTKVIQETRKVIEPKPIQPKPLAILPKPVEPDPLLIIIPIAQSVQMVTVEETKTNPVKDKLKNLILSNQKDRGIELRESGLLTSASQKPSSSNSNGRKDAISDKKDTEKVTAQQERWKAAAKRYR